MYKKRLLSAIFAFVLFLISCASPMKERLFSKERPRFDGIVTPISIPIQPEYMPASAKFKFEIITGIENEGTEISMNGNYKISRLGDLLVWDTKITKFKKDNQTIARTLPIFESRILTNKIGVVKEFEASLPAFDKTEIDEKKRNKLYREMKKNIRKFTRIFPQTSVKSGDILMCYLKGSEIQEFIAEIIKELTSQGISLKDDFRNYKDINLILKGWSYYENKKVAVGSIDDALFLGNKTSDIAINIGFDGYSLFDSATFHPLKMEFLITINLVKTSSKESVTGKVLSSYSAKLGS